MSASSPDDATRSGNAPPSDNESYVDVRTTHSTCSREPGVGFTFRRPVARPSPVSGDAPGAAAALAASRAGHYRGTVRMDVAGPAETPGGVARLRQFGWSHPRADVRWPTVAPRFNAVVSVRCTKKARTQGQTPSFFISEIVAAPFAWPATSDGANCHRHCPVS